MTKVLAAALLLVLAGTGLASAQDAKPKEKQVGPREIDFTPLKKDCVGGEGIVLRFVVTAEDGEPYDVDMHLDGLSRAQAQGAISRSLKRGGWDVEDIPDKIIVKGRKGKAVTSLELTLTGLPPTDKPIVRLVEKK
jgi:hypothetical protein